MRMIQFAAACGVVLSTAAAADAQGIDWAKVDTTCLLYTSDAADE